MAIRVNPTETPNTTGNPEIIIEVTDDGGGGESFCAAVFASYDPTHLKVISDSISPADGVIEPSNRSGGQQVAWPTTPITDEGMPHFSFQFECLISGNPGFACWAVAEDGSEHPVPPIPIRHECP